jgi:hypothetical protein
MPKKLFAPDAEAQFAACVSSIIGKVNFSPDVESSFWERFTSQFDPAGHRDVDSALYVLRWVVEHGAPGRGSSKSFESVDGAYRAWMETLEKDLGMAAPPVRARPVIQRPPCMRLNALANFICTKKLYERVFQPILADMQQEYFEALQEGNGRKAQWVMWCGRLAFIAAAVAQIPVSAMKLIVRLWKAAH